MRVSAGLLVYRRHDRAVEVLLVHPGGPFWRNRDDRAWSVPKGEVDEGEDWLADARREMREETGFAPEEWPPRSGRVQRFPEVDRAGWFEIAEAKRKILRGQVGLLDELEQLLPPTR
jgi:predicted NUDIX family NTP pyrophosphohydrolase